MELNPKDTLELTAEFTDLKDEEKSLPDIPWTEEHENILVDWADKAMCYRWLHARANQRYARMNALFTIPTIIMSTLTGTANFAQDRFPDDYKEYAPMMIGAVNIFAGILTTVQQFLKVGELNEAHRVASISWDKFYRNIKVELAKNPKERTSVSHMLKHSKEEYDRLMETSPVISDQIIRQFKRTFEDSKDEMSEKARAFNELKKPEICDSLESTKLSVYRPKHQEQKGPSNSMLDMIKRKRDETRKAKIIEDFIVKFREEYSREPSTDEIYENLQENIAESFIKRIVGNREANAGAGSSSQQTLPKQQTQPKQPPAALTNFRNAVGLVNAKMALGEKIDNNRDDSMV